MKPIQPFNPAIKFVRVIHKHPNGLVAFEFAVGEPDLYVELLLPQMAFDAFCASHGVTPTQGHLDQPAGDAQEWDWSLESARSLKPRHEAAAC